MSNEEEGGLVSNENGQNNVPTANSKSSKKPKKKERSVRRRNRDICDIFGEAAMFNAYNISHNVQDFLYYRGFPWIGHKK